MLLVAPQGNLVLRASFDVVLTSFSRKTVTRRVSEENAGRIANAAAVSDPYGSVMGARGTTVALLAGTHPRWVGGGLHGPAEVSPCGTNLLP